MSATLIGNNVTTKVSAAVSVSSTTTGVKYTAPATGYAIVQVWWSATTGTPTWAIATGKTAPAASTAFTTLYLGPSQNLEVVTNASAVTFYVAGVEFVNSP